MDRYSKTYSTKWQNRYSEEFKQFICNEFLTGTATRRSIEKKYNVGHGQLTFWLKQLGYDYSKPSIVSLPMMADQPDKLSTNKEVSLSQLKKELQEARLLAETYRRMIEVAEHEFKIKIVKKSNTK
ncbi:transposase [Aquimarina sp. Aq78]|uniref:transposase n=1 Tax=Aquimarina sp. Aq78 TaxID=1191889 RepID=UPI0020C35FEA|nr:transposase [Aquimarina sp. Aq78]